MTSLVWRERKEAMKKKDFLSITDLSAKEIWQVLLLAKKLKKELKAKGQNISLLANKQMVMLFEKPILGLYKD